MIQTKTLWQSFLMVTALEESKKVNKRKRCTWVQPWLQNTPTLGAYHALLQELQCSDQKSLRNFLRMDVESFAQLMQKVAPLITRQETSYYLIYRRKYNFICKHNLATNKTAGFQSPDSKFLRRNRAVTNSEQVPRTRKNSCENAWHTN